MGPLRLYEIYHAMKLHWTSNSYDFVKFKGRLKNISRITLDQSPQRDIFYRLHKQYKIEKDFVLTILPFFIESNTIHISALLSKEHTEEKANAWYRKIQRMPTFFAEDCDAINSYIKEHGMTFQQFFYGNGILDFLLYDKINLESFIILDKITNFLAKNNTDNIIFRQVYEIRAVYYSSFISVDLKRYEAIFKKSMKKKIN